MDLRNLCHHCESPFLIIKDDKIFIQFERLYKLKNIRYFNKYKPSTKDPIIIEITSHDLGDDVIESLNKWAKRHLEKVNQNESIEAIYGYRKNGSMKTKKIKLNELMKSLKLYERNRH